jgi:predicted dehydrogenase
MKKYKVAVIGCGWIGMGAMLDPLRPSPASHTSAICQNELLELVALMDTDPLAEKFAKKLYPEVPFFTSNRALFEHLIPDVVVIATHPDTHCSFIEAAAHAGVKLVLSEKPISHNEKEAEAAIILCAEKNVILLVNHMRRFSPIIRDFKRYINNEYVRDTSLGKPRVVLASYDNGLYHGGTHIIDLIRFLFGEPKSVTAILNRQVDPGKDDVNVDAIIEFDSFNVMLYYINSKECAVCELSVIGERGVIRFRDMWGGTIDVIGTVTNTDFVNHRIPDYANAKSYKNNDSMMIGTYQHLVACLEGLEEPLCTGEDALKTLRVLRAISQSTGLHGKTIKL